ncbi:MAG: hypothetical protein ACLVEU_02625 [Bacteroides cellulosilyticus]
MRNAPKRSIFARWQENTQRRKPLSGMVCRQPPDKMQEKPAQNRLYEAPFRTETQKGVFVMKYDAKEFKKYPEIMNKRADADRLPHQQADGALSSPIQPDSSHLYR